MRGLIRFVAGVLAVLSISIVFSALSGQGPKPLPWIRCQPTIAGRPVNAVFIELLVQKEDLDEWYTDFEPSNGTKFGVSPSSEIALYTSEGYVSFTFHCRNSVSSIWLGNQENHYSENVFGGDENDEKALELFDRFKTIRFVFLSVDGDILAVTNESRTENAFPFFARKTFRVTAEQLTASFRFAPTLSMIILSPVFAALAAVLFANSKKFGFNKSRKAGTT